MADVVPHSIAWLLLQKWVRNVNLHQIVQSKCKIN